MNLNSRDKLILIAVLVIVLWVAGIVSFIKPAINDVKTAQNTLDAKEVELEDKKAQIEKDKNLPQDIRAAYDKANETGKVFYVKMEHQHDAATEMQKKLDVDGDEGNGQEIKNFNLSVSMYSAINLSKYVYTPSTVSSTLDTIMASMDQTEEAATTAGDVPILSAYTFGLDFEAKKSDVIQFLENLQNSEKKSLVVQSLEISDVGENEDDTEWVGSMSVTLYMIPQLKDPDEVNKQIDEGSDVAAVDDIAE